MMYSGLSPVDAKDIANTFSESGLLVKYTASGVAITTDAADAPFAVTIDESSRDASGALEAAGTGTVSLVGLSGVQYIRCMAISGIKSGTKLYTSLTVDNDGYVDDDATGTVFVGVYMGEDGIDIATGDLVPVLCATIQ